MNSTSIRLTEGRSNGKRRHHAAASSGIEINSIGVSSVCRYSDAVIGLIEFELDRRQKPPAGTACQDFEIEKR